MNRQSVTTSATLRRESSATERHIALLQAVESPWVDIPQREILPVYPASQRNNALSYKRLWPEKPDKSVVLGQIIRGAATECGRLGELVLDRLEGRSVPEYMGHLQYFSKFGVASNDHRVGVFRNAFLMELDHIRGHLQFFETYRDSPAVRRFNPGLIIRWAVNLSRFHSHTGWFGDVAGDIRSALFEMPPQLFCEAKEAVARHVSYSRLREALQEIAVHHKDAGDEIRSRIVAR